MSQDQMFVIAVLTLVIPVVSAVVTIVGGVVLFDRQNKKLEAVKQSADNAATKSEAAELAANHSKEVVSALQQNFKAVVEIVAPRVAGRIADTTPAPSNLGSLVPAASAAPAKVIIVNPDPVPVVDATKTKKPGETSH